MAIVKMSKLSVIGLESDKSALFDELMDLGVVELNDVSDKLLSEEWTDRQLRSIWLLNLSWICMKIYWFL